MTVGVSIVPHCTNDEMRRNFWYVRDTLRYLESRHIAMKKIAHTIALPETLITTYLEITRRAAFRPAFLQDSSHISIVQMQTPDVPFYLFLYQEVGEQWLWIDRLKLNYETLEEMLANPAVTVDVLYVDGVPAGYVEIARVERTFEIAYFGLRSPFFGRGLGKHLLSHGIKRSLDEGAHRIWLHTCNLDGPQALSNYLKRGFRVYKVEEESMPKKFQMHL